MEGDGMELVTIGPQERGQTRNLSLGQLLLLNSVVCGLEFCACAAFSYIPPMLLKAGLSEGQMSWILGAGPFLGLILVPVIGRASDKCQSSFGRRRPFILGLSIVLLISLLIIPYGEYFSFYAFGSGTSGKHFGVCLLIIGSILLDFASQACLTPVEALLSDACKNTNQQDQCFTVYSFMVSIGGCIGYLLTSMDWNNYSVGLYFGNQERTVFSIIIISFLFSMISTLFVAQEVPQTKQDVEALMQNGEVIVTRDDAGYETASNQSTSDDYNNHNKNTDHDLACMEKGTTLSSTPEELPSPRKSVYRSVLTEDCSVTLPLLCPSPFRKILRFVGRKLLALLPGAVVSLLNIPFCLKRLATANFFSWTAIMTFNLFFTDFVGQAVYGGNPNAADDSPLAKLYDEGVRMGSWGLLLHCITAALYAPLIERISARYGAMRTYLIGMMSFTAAMTIMVFSTNIVIVNSMAACTGFGYATLTTIPFSLVSTYHEHKETFFYDIRGPGGTVQTRGIGTDMATLDTAYFLSQIVLSVLVGQLVDYSGSVIFYVIISASIGAISCFFIIRIIFDRKQIMSLIHDGHLKPVQVIDT